MLRNKILELKLKINSNLLFETHYLILKVFFKNMREMLYYAVSRYRRLTFVVTPFVISLRFTKRKIIIQKQYF